MSPSLAPSLLHSWLKKYGLEQPDRIRVSEALCGPVYSPAIAAAVHCRAATGFPALFVLSSSVVPALALKWSLGPGPNRHSYLPVSPPALAVVQAAFLYPPLAALS